MSDTSVESPSVFDERMREEAAAAGRVALETALTRFTVEQRDAFWNAIGLYYSTRRHPGAGEIAAPAATPAI
ncbi:hypothetical protein MPAR168_11395 [Methylorubrum populi]|uniref:Uncharacterized protein n=1 Tax=Methylobacterium radiotolerans TaxID=31998 RepID=A0ABU7TEL2_9HYPH|nr:hypothetical protein [Methylobacterium sp. B4]PXW66941.1 hypothetical protein BY998_101502 [Methylobacterium sp. B4]